MDSNSISLLSYRGVFPSLVIGFGSKELLGKQGRHQITLRRAEAEIFAFLP